MYALNEKHREVPIPSFSEFDLVWRFLNAFSITEPSPGRFIALHNDTLRVWYEHTPSQRGIVRVERAESGMDRRSILVAEPASSLEEFGYKLMTYLWRAGEL